jgi:hypothetical protein
VGADVQGGGVTRVLSFREHQKYRGIILRGGPLATCDLSGRWLGFNGHWHEIIHRGWTSGKAREHSYRLELCAYLSADEHARYHDVMPSEAMRLKMWRRIYQILAKKYGDGTAYSRMEEAFNMVVEASRIPPPILLPSWDILKEP